MMFLNKNKKTVFILAAIFDSLLILGLVLFFFSRPESHQTSIYVDSNYQGEEEGTIEMPFRNINSAIDFSRRNDTIFIKKGIYEGDFDIPPRISLVGEDRDNTIINGPITMNHLSSISDVTVSGGKKTINLEDDSNVEISNSIIEKGRKIGINIPEGNGKLKISDSIIRNNGKGFYAQQGSHIEISNCEIYGNLEEAVDIRNNVDGFIIGNDIHSNYEPGIETLLGNNVLLISNNKLSNNDSSGISTQFYEDHSAIGFVTLENNEIKNNTSYGIKCASPSGGNPASGYWFNSVEIKDNAIENNTDGEIQNRCKFLLDGSPRNLSKESQASESQKSSAKIYEMILDEILDKETGIERELEFIQEDLQKEVSKDNFYKFFAINKKDIIFIENEITEAREKISLLKSSVENLQNESLKLEILRKTGAYEKILLEKEDQLEKLKRFGIGRFL